MQLVLELLKKIFVALQGVYTKEESDSALAVRDTNIATNTTNIDWLMTAADGDWKAYMLARAAKTGVQANIEKVRSAIVEYSIDDSAQLASRLIADWKNLFGYETWLASVGEPSPLDAAFWTAYFVALAEWEANPTATEQWTVTKNADGTYSSNCPYFAAAQNEPVINFAVTSAAGNYPTPLLNRSGSAIYYLPNLATVETFNYISQGDNIFILPKATSGRYFSWGARTFNTPVYFPMMTQNSMAFNECAKFNAPVTVGSLIDGNAFFRLSAANRVFNLSSLSSGVNMFANSKMSAENISATLDTLPAHTDGETHTISFVGCPGASELTQDSPSVAAAVARGWTVEL